MAAVHGCENSRALRLDVVDMVAPSLEDKHGETGLLRETRRERQASCAAADNSETASVPSFVSQRGIACAQPYMKSYESRAAACQRRQRPMTGTHLAVNMVVGWEKKTHFS